MSAAALGRTTSIRGRLIVAAVVIVCGMLVAGLAFAARRMIDPGVDNQSRDATSAGPSARPNPTAQQQMDTLAAAPMATLPASAALPHTLLPTTIGPVIALPAPVGQRGLVSTGFPRTTAGAIAQFAAIDAAALAGLNPSQVAQVYGDWSVPGADPVTLWSVSQFVDRTLGSSGIPNGSSSLQSTFAVSEAQVKGVLDGGEFVLACINGELDISYLEQTTRTGAADCARLVWSGARWQIGAGSQPAIPPSAWPGTAEAAQAGWQPVHHAT